MLNCIKNAYLKMQKEGLTPLEFNFPSFNINTEQYKNVGMQILEDKVKMAVNSGDYNVVFSFEDIEDINNKITKKLASIEENKVFNKIEEKLLKSIEADPNITRLEMSHSILNRICAETMGVELAKLSYYQGFKNPEPLSERQAQRVEAYDHAGVMNVMGSNEENKFVASLIMLKYNLPKAYKIATQALKSFSDRATSLNELQGFDLTNSDDLTLATKIINENKMIKNMVHRIQMNEKAPNVNVVEEIAKIDMKYALETFPIQAKQMKSLEIVKKPSLTFIN